MPLKEKHYYITQVQGLIHNITGIPFSRIGLEVANFCGVGIALTDEAQASALVEFAHQLAQTPQQEVEISESLFKLLQVGLASASLPAFVKARLVGVVEERELTAEEYAALQPPVPSEVEAGDLDVQTGSPAEESQTGSPAEESQTENEESTPNP